MTPEPERPTSVTPRARPAALAPLIPAGVMLILWLVWIGESGGYFPSLWYPSVVGAAVLLVVTLLRSEALLPRHGAARIALLAFAALVALNYLSIVWSGSKGAALAAANKLLLYLVIAWLFSVLPWTPRVLAVLLCAWSLGIVAFCAAGLVRATSAVHLDPFFVEARYSTPLNYSNATAALAVMGMWPGLILSARRELPGVLRVILLAGAVFLAEFALLPQSRAGLLGLILTAPLAIAVGPSRLRLLARLAIVGAGLAFSVPRTVNVDKALNAGAHVAPVLSRAASAMLLSGVLALALGTLLVFAERRIAVPRVLRHRPALPSGRRGWLALGVAAVLALGGASALAAPAISRLVNQVWHSGKTDARTGSTRLFSASPEERFDYVRVSLDLFAGSPVLGTGAADFGRRYDGLKRFSKHSQYVHNLALRTLSETGMLGFALFTAVVIALSLGLARVARQLGGGLGHGCASAAFLVATYFLVHASLDWLEEFPVLAVPALSFPLAVIALRPAARVAQRRKRGARLRVLAALGLVATGLVVGLALYGPYLSERYMARALNSYNARPSGAYSDLARAAALNPWSADPPIGEGTVAEGLRDSTRAHAAFVRALRLEQDWYSWLQVAVLDSNSGRFALAIRELGRAAKLDVGDPLIDQARTMINQHQPIDPLAFNLRGEQGPNTSLFKTHIQ